MIQRQPVSYLSASRVLSTSVILLGILALPVFAVEVGLTHGPIIGAVRATSVRIWVRTSAPVPVRVEYGSSPAFTDAALSNEVTTASERDLTAKLRLTGLAPETEYFYRIRLNGIAGPEVYRFTTSPWKSATRTFSFIVLSDFRARQAPVYASAAQENPAFVIFLGDFDHRDPPTLSEMRTMHRELRGGETAGGRDFLKHISRFPFYHVWDDHDFGVNEADRTFPGKQEALKAFREYFPTPSLPSDDGIWHQFRYAQAEFFMLDLRSQRDPNGTPDGPNKSILGAEQKAWLKAALSSSTARWKFLMSTVPFNPSSKPFDGWGAFQTEQVEITEFIKQLGITGVTVISGDIHTGGALDDATNSRFPEVSVPHANIPVCDDNAPCRCHTARNSPGTWSEGLICGIDNPGYALITILVNSVKIQIKGSDGSVRLSMDLQ